ncbi:MAG: GntR family transcriptional regulator [Caenibius sp.]
MAREFGLTGARLAVLVEVGRNSGEGTATGIAEHLGTSRQAVQRILNVIASLGYVSLRPGTSDKRQRVASLTPAGRKILDKTRSTNNGLADRSAMEESASAPRSTGEGALQQGRTIVPRSFETVRNHVLRQIRLGNLDPGDKLPPERDLGVQLGVGRPVVREALRSLEMAGVIKILRGSHGGAFVRESSSEGIRDSIEAMLVVGRISLDDLLEMRSIFVAQSAYLGAERGTVEDFARIEASISRLENAVAEGDQLPGVLPAGDFYRAVAGASHNPMLVLIMDALLGLVAQMLSALGDWPRIDSVTPRRRVLQAMREGHADRAARLLHEHAEHSRSILDPYKEKLP